MTPRLVDSIKPDKPKRKRVKANPWLIDAIVRVAPDAGMADRNMTGHIVDVDHSGKVRVVTVHLQNGRIIKFLASQLVLD